MNASSKTTTSAGRNNRQRIVLALIFLAASLPVLTAAPSKDVPYSAAVLKNPQDALKNMDAPWPLLEQLLEAGERRAVENYREKLSLPKQADADFRAQALLFLYDGDYPAAQQAMLQVKSDDPWTAEKKRYLDGLLDATTGFVESPSDHFRLRTRREDVFLSQYALRCLENAQSKMNEVFGLSASTTVVVEIYPTAERFSAASTLSDDKLERSGAIGICKFRRLMILSPQATPLGYRWLDALSHEYNHYLINELSGSLCPLWLHEGVARYYETAWRRAGSFQHPASAENALAQAALSITTTVIGVDGSTVAVALPPSAEGQAVIPFERMEPSMVYLKDQEEVSLAFAEVSDAVGYIIDRFGQDKLVDLLKAFRDHPRAEAFERALGVSEGELQTAWRDSLVGRSWQVSKGAMAQTIRLRPVDETQFAGVDAQGHIRLGDRLRQQDQMSAALAEYKKALDDEPNNGVALLKAARAYQAMEKIDQAEAALRLAVEKNPSYVTPYVVLGELIYDDGRHEEAQRVLQEALEINPFHPGIHEILGLMALDVGNFPTARRYIETSLRLKPDNPDLRDTLKHMPGDR